MLLPPTFSQCLSPTDPRRSIGYVARRRRLCAPAHPIPDQVLSPRPGQARPVDLLPYWRQHSLIVPTCCHRPPGNQVFYSRAGCQDRVRVEARQRDLVAAATTPHRQLAEAVKAGSWLDGAGSGRSTSAGRDPLNPGTRACLASDSGAASRAVVVAKWLSAVGSAVACSETPNCERGRGLAQCGVGQYGGGVRMGHDTMLPYEPRMVEHGSVRQSFVST